MYTLKLLACSMLSLPLLATANPLAEQSLERAGCAKTENTQAVNWFHESEQYVMYVPVDSTWHTISGDPELGCVSYSKGGTCVDCNTLMQAVTLQTPGNCIIQVFYEEFNTLRYYDVKDKDLVVQVTAATPKWIKCKPLAAERRGLEETAQTSEQEGVGEVVPAVKTADTETQAIPLGCEFGEYTQPLIWISATDQLYVMYAPVDDHPHRVMDPKRELHCLSDSDNDACINCDIVMKGVEVQDRGSCRFSLDVEQTVAVLTLEDVTAFHGVVYFQNSTPIDVWCKHD